ncbi:MAG: hypothetical protein QXT77_07575 [Candidatus Methanomethylicaceae archaeon]
MAKKRRKSRSTVHRIDRAPTYDRYNPRPPRDTVDITSRRLRPVVFSLPRSGPILSEIEDRRRYTPSPWIVATAREPARVVVDRSRYSPFIAHRFPDPERVLVCARRQIRKEVMHARGVAGGKVRRPRRNELSKISCKR